MLTAKKKIRNHQIRIRLRFGTVLLYIAMIALVAFTILPLVYVVTTSFKPYDELFRYPPRFFVQHPSLDNFSSLFKSISTTSVPFARYLLNSIITTLITAAGTIIISSLGAYGLTQLRPKGSNIIMSLVIAALMFNSQVTLIPSYMMVKNLSLLNTLASLIIPKLASAFNFFLMVQFMSQIPNSLAEAARIDSAGEMRICWSVITPCVRPAWATIFVFTFISVWNDIMSPLIYIFDEDKKTLPLFLQTIGGGVGSAAISKAGAAAAGTLIMIFPTIIVFCIMQRFVIETMTYSGIKA